MGYPGGTVHGLRRGLQIDHALRIVGGGHQVAGIVVRGRVRRLLLGPEAPGLATASLRVPSILKCASDSRSPWSAAHTALSNRARPASCTSSRCRFLVKTVASKVGKSCARVASDTALIRRRGWSRGTRSLDPRCPACRVGDWAERTSGIPPLPSGQIPTDPVFSSLLVARGDGIGDHQLHCSDSVFAAGVRRQFANPLPDVPGNNRSRLVHIHCSVTQLLIVNAGIKFRDWTPVDGRGPR